MVNESLTAMYQRITRALAHAIALSGSCVLVGLLISVLVDPTHMVPRLLYGAILSLGVGGGLLALYWLPRRPLWHVTTFLGSTVLVLLVCVAILLPDLVVVSVPYLTLVVLLISFGGQPVLTRSFFGLALVLAVLLPLRLTDQLAGLAPIQLELGALRQGVVIASFIVLIAAVFQVAMTLFHAQVAALTMADAHLASSDAARAAAEQAQHEIAARHAEQARLLDLIAVLEAPVVTLAPGLLFLPLMGALDPHRLATLGTRVLHTVADQRAGRIILDLTGVVLADATVVRALQDLMTSIQLLGCAVSLTGVSGAVALHLVAQERTFVGIDIAARPYEVLLQFLPGVARR